MPTDNFRHKQMMLDLPIVYKFCKNCEKVAVVNVFSKDNNCGFCKKHFKKFLKEMVKEYENGDK